MAKLKEQVKDFSKFVAKTAVAAVKGEKVRASPEEATRRYQLCLICPKFKESKCELCGCKMGIKVQWQETKCADKENPRW